ncbi:MAG: hypothetical protein J5933_04295 [Clostridia bacterium]|nr:hypothetical protein [Clostridia bacterium]
MKDLISARELTDELLAMRALLTDALKNDNSVFGELMRDYRKGSLKPVNDLLKSIRLLQEEAD